MARKNIPVHRKRDSNGRPTVYNPTDVPDLARRACLLGATNVKLAEFFGVAEQTIDLWISSKPEFAKAVYEGREGANQDVASSLYHRAVGYKHEAEKIFCTKDGDIIRAEYTEQYAPDPASMIFWLKNRRRDLWRDKFPDDDAPQNINIDNRTQTVNNVITAQDAAKEYKKLLGR